MNKKHHSHQSPQTYQSNNNGFIPPQAIDIEEAVLAAMMLEKTAIARTEGLLFTECFYKPKHQQIFKAINKLYVKGSPVDLLTVSQQLKESGDLESIGGPVALTQITDQIARAAHVEHHARIIYDKYIQRELISFAQNLQNVAFQGESDAAIDYYENQSRAIDNLFAGRATMRHIKDIAADAEKSLIDREEKAKSGKLAGIPSGLVDLDKLTNGWLPNRLIILAARPGMGKTAVALNQFGKKAAQEGFNVCVFSLEMDSVSLFDRIILSYGGINRSRFESGYMKKEDWEAYHRAQDEIVKLDIYIDENDNAKVNYIRSVCQNKKRKGECDMVIIDYLQLIESNNDYYGAKNREREVAEITRDLKKMSKALDIPVILLCQLNRGVENRTSKEPQLADLRESGAIEQDADIVSFIWRPEYYKIDALGEGAEINTKDLCIIKIAKHRGGRLDDIFFRHNGDLTRFYDYASDDYIPNDNKSDTGEPF